MTAMLQDNPQSNGSSRSHRMELDCGIAYARLIGWLDGELGLSHLTDASWQFFTGSGASCIITLTPVESRTLGTIALERTRLEVEGSKEACDDFLALFTLRFISAGG